LYLDSLGALMPLSNCPRGWPTADNGGDNIDVSIGEGAKLLLLGDVAGFGSGFSIRYFALTGAGGGRREVEASERGNTTRSTFQEEGEATPSD
jgi:hypothetical protein